MLVKYGRLALFMVAFTFVLGGCGGGKPEVAQKYDNKIVHQPPANRGKEDGWFLVQNGKRRWITNMAWVEKNGYKPSDVIEISSDDFAAIPEDPAPLNP